MVGNALISALQPADFAMHSLDPVGSRAITKRLAPGRASVLVEIPCPFRQRLIVFVIDHG
jgi:hypothetical protein